MESAQKLKFGVKKNCLMMILLIVQDRMLLLPCTEPGGNFLAQIHISKNFH
uniref:Uncharacterized protein n=1 Tax=Anguilla anguilla TaxID=7936 RepID=A0A0E9PKK6_ANGAN